jgi:hypothetical protein
MQIRRRQLRGEPPVHSRSMVKISYNIKMTTQKIRSHDDRRSATWICSSSPTMIYSIIQIYKKPSQCSRLQYKHYIIHDEVQKGESDSPIHISIDEQISIHFGKTYIQDDAGAPSLGTSAHRTFSFLGPKNLKFFYFPIGKPAPTDSPLHDPPFLYLSKDRNSRLRKFPVNNWALESPRPDGLSQC